MLIKRLIAMSAAVLVSFSAFAAKIEEAAPEFTLQNSMGEAVSLDDYKGKFVILEWTNHKCPYVVKTLWQR